MADREKVIKGLEDIVEYFGIMAIFEQGCNEPKQDVENAIALLKEQNAVEPINSYGTFRCGNCKNIVGHDDGHGCGYQNNFCCYCGKKVSWNES